MNKVHCRALAEISRSQEDGDDLIIFGRASAGNLDRKGTFIDQDSLWESALRFQPRTLLWQHDMNAPIGTVEELARGKDELLARARVGKDFEVPVSVGLGAIMWNVNNIRSLVRQSIVRGYSIGFSGVKQEDKDGGPPTIIVDDFLEISLCSIPANQTTTFGFARSMIVKEEPYKSNTFTGFNTTNVTPARFEFAPEERSADEELEVWKFALHSLQEAVADWK